MILDHICVSLLVRKLKMECCFFVLFELSGDPSGDYQYVEIYL